MDSNLIVLTDQDGNSVRFELLDIVEYKEDEYAALYPADGGDDEPVHNAEDSFWGFERAILYANWVGTK